MYRCTWAGHVLTRIKSSPISRDIAMYQQSYALPWFAGLLDSATHELARRKIGWIFDLAFVENDISYRGTDLITVVSFFTYYVHSFPLSFLSSQTWSSWFREYDLSMCWFSWALAVGYGFWLYIEINMNYTAVALSSVSAVYNTLPKWQKKMTREIPLDRVSCQAFDPTWDCLSSWVDLLKQSVLAQLTKQVILRRRNLPLMAVLICFYVKFGERTKRTIHSSCCIITRHQLR